MICSSIRLYSNPSNDSSFYNRGFALVLVFPKFELQTNSKNINSYLNDFDFPLIPESSFNFGFGLQQRLNHFTISVDATIGHQNISNTNSKTELRRLMLGTGLNFSYNILYKKAFLADLVFYPFAGISTSENILYLSKDIGNSTFTDLLSVNSNTTQIEHFDVGLNLGFGFNLTNLHIEELGLLGINVGYRFNPDGEYLWESKFADISDSPSDNFNHFFIQINLGGGLNWKK